MGTDTFLIGPRLAEVRDSKNFVRASSGVVEKERARPKVHGVAENVADRGHFVTHCIRLVRPNSTEVPVFYE